MGGIWDAFMETMLSRLDALLIHLVQYGQCHMEFEYTEQGEVYMVVIPEHVSFVCPYGYTNGGFLAIEQTVNLVFKVQTFAAPGRR